MTRTRLVVTTACLLVWGAAVGVRLIDLHVVRSAYYSEKAADQHLMELELSPQRGAIRDRNGNDLAISIDVYSLYAQPATVEDPNTVAAILAPIIGDSVDSIRTRLTADRSFVWLKRKMTASQSDAVREAALPGLGLLTEAKRFYPNVTLASHVLGFVNLDNQGAGGLEYEYDDLISGTPGRLVVQRDARNVSYGTREQSPTEGASLTTTLDRDIQHFVEEEIEKSVRETGAEGMTIIVMEPDTGAILAMANYPTFNPNEYSRFPETSWTNRAIKHGYEPGSTFKIATAAAVLDEKLADIDERVDGQNGAIMVQGYRIRDHEPYGLLTLREVIQYSSNVGIIQFGTRLGDDRFARYIEQYGFGRVTGIDLMGEERGMVRDPADWSGLSSSVISMGQEILTTPLQILNMAAAVGNGGTMYRPFVVERIHHVDGRVEEIEPTGDRVMSARTASLLQDALGRVVTDGTGLSAAIPGYTAAGKTGTAQKINPETGRYSTSKYVASFVGYAPARNPEIAAIVVIDEPSGDYYGGSVAAPVFSRVAERILRNLRVRPDAPQAPSNHTDGEGSAPRTAPRSQRAELVPVTWMSGRATPEVAVSVLPGGGMESVNEVGSERFPLPNLMGKPLRQVVLDAARLGLHLETVGSGVAVDQMPRPGALVEPDARIEVRFSTSLPVAASNADASVP